MYEKNTPLAYKMMSYVTNFARTGDPNGRGLPEWPAYTPDRRNRMHLNTEITIQPIDDQQVQRYEWYAERELEEVLVGSLSRAISGEE